MVPITLVLNLTRHEIERNLHFLLQKLRILEVTDDTWINALCIDHDDQKEKTEQVKPWGRIYSGAREVLVGLENEADDTMATVMGLAQDMHPSKLDALMARQSIRHHK